MNRLAGLDVARVLAVLLVAYGHFSSVGGFAPGIPGVVAEGGALPIFDGTKYWGSQFEIFAIQNLNTQTGILGVTLFFIVTGYLMPMMMDRYSRAQFLVNRGFRIFPPMFVALAMIGGFVWYTQGIAFGVDSYIGSASLTYPVMKVVPVVGILWTLVVEVLFYFIAAAVGKFTISKVYGIAIACFILVVADGYLKNEWVTLAANQAKFIAIILIGSAGYLIQKSENKAHAAVLLGLVTVGALACQGIWSTTHNDASTYRNFGTFVWACGAFSVLLAASGLKPVQWAAKFVQPLADMVYPMYLLHVPIGLGVMYMLRGHVEPTGMILSGFCAAFISSMCLHYLAEKPSINLSRMITKRMAKGRAAWDAAKANPAPLHMPNPRPSSPYPGHQAQEGATV